ncbi:MAG TPA: AAA family ATPase [Vineibacter sp.]|nr:AAA family ATPase [Vineibacter sp.]
MDVDFRLAPGELYRACGASLPSFDTTAQLEPLEAPLGQERAVAALELGIAMRRPGYNMYALGSSGSGRLEVVRAALTRRAKSQPTPSDWCYVQNFKDSSKPRALCLPSGRAAALGNTVRRLIDDLRVVLPASFNAPEYQNRRQIIEERLKEKHEQAFGGIDRRAREQNVALIRTPMGFALAPIRDGNVMQQEDFAKLPEEARDQFNKSLQAFQEELEATLRQVPQWHRDHAEELRQLNREATRLTVSSLMESMRKAFADISAVVEFLNDMADDIIERAEELFLKPREAGEGGTPSVPEELSALRRYRVNVIVDHSSNDGAPVDHEANPTHQNLVGRVEHVARFGALLTDFNLIRAGALHRANGGYLVLDARSTIINGVAWESLKRALRAGQIRIESVEQLMSLGTTIFLEPEAIPLDVKVVLVGERMLYYLLSEADPEFADLFKVEVDFDDDVSRSPDSTMLYARLVAQIVRALRLGPFDRSAVALVIEQAARRAGDGLRLSTEMRPLRDLLCEADHHRQVEGSECASTGHVRAAIEAQRFRASRIYERLTDQIAQGTILIDVAGVRVGQVNGLSVTSLGNFAFGRPARITATARAGRGTVVDIERAAKLGGALHSKGVMILSGYLAATYLPDRPLSLGASLVFEQSYGMIDGDSASSAELYALLSAIAEVPLRQDLAVTGSVNQMGEVQAIGGVNEKIEGFFDVCRAKGLSGTQGVVIPKANVRHLMLRDDVVGAVEEGRFHIYAVSAIDEGLALLTGQTVGERLADGRYPDASINARIERRLHSFTERMKAAVESSEARKGTEERYDDA